MNASLGFWLETTEQWGAGRSERVAVYKDLRGAYCAKSRHYHDLTHIEHMFEVANEVSDQIEDYEAMYLAIWFHDAVQKIGRDSEQLSADYAKKKLQELNAPIALINNVAVLILATKHGDSLDVKRVLGVDEKLISDIDLCILGSKKHEYFNYVKECRKEYPITDFIYKRGRKKFLNKMIEGSHIFLTDYFKNRYEERALDNIGFELSEIN